MDRREFIGWAAAAGAALLIGAIGGITDGREPRKGSEHDRRQHDAAEQEPPSTGQEGERTCRR